jgi:hypothetical protein
MKIEEKKKDENRGWMGVVRPPLKGQKKKKNKKKNKNENKKLVKMGFGLWGVAGPWSGQSHPRPLGVVRPPLKAQYPFFLFFFFFFFFFFWPFGGGQTTPLGMGVVRPPPSRPWGWLEPPPIFIPFFEKIKNKNNGQNNVVLGRGGCCSFGIIQG